ncbi:MAG: D-hexose-6-phosphate mutarotase [Chthoniobacteraceae bacterium]
MTASDLRPLEIPGATFAEGSGGLTVLDIATPLARARIFIHGAHVAEWTPAGAQPVLFMSAASHFAPGKAIRGGVPVCFPWFGGRAGHPDSPAHGFARSVEWGVESLVREDDGTISVSLILADSDATRAHWPHAFLVRHRIRVGTALEMTLEVTNRDTAPFAFEEALHTYFAVSAVQSVEVHGLEGAEFIDKVGGVARKRQPAEPLRFTGETDRVFPNTTATCVLHDVARQIAVEKSGSATTVVWNPWIAKAKAMADFGDDEWPGMACIETANSGEDTITLAAGAKHAMTARIRLA